MTSRLPSLFLSHGSPMLAIEDSAAGRFLDGLGASITKPAAILIASAHFDRAGPVFGSTAQLSTIHDFHGFPDDLYTLRYAANGQPDLAERASGLLRGAGFSPGIDPERGLDHGAWVPLRRMYPQADIPVLAMSIDSHADAAWHYRVGRALAPLRDEGVLVIGSGGFSHNLRELDWHGRGSPPAAWMKAFTDPMRALLLEGNAEAALQWRNLPDAMRNHPTPEHLLPLFVALGAAGEPVSATLLHDSIEMGSLALDAFAFDNANVPAHADARIASA